MYQRERQTGRELLKALQLLGIRISCFCRISQLPFDGFPFLSPQLSAREPKELAPTHTHYVGQSAVCVGRVWRGALRM